MHCEFYHKVIRNHPVFIVFISGDLISKSGTVATLEATLHIVYFHRGNVTQVIHYAGVERPLEPINQGTLS